MPTPAPTYNHCPSCGANFDRHDGNWTEQPVGCSQCDAEAVCWICPACEAASCEACAVKPCALTDDSVDEPTCTVCGDYWQVEDGLCKRCREQPDDEVQTWAQFAGGAR